MIVAAGKEFVGSYLDTGNPVFVAEHPLTTVEKLGPYAVCFHLRDSVVYEVPDGIAVKWVPLGEGTVDFKKIIAKAREVCPAIAVYNKPITGRPPYHLAIYDPAFMMTWSDMRASDLARFLALAKHGRPFEGHMVIEDVPGKPPDAIAAALLFQQQEHMRRGIEYARQTLDLGREVARLIGSDAMANPMAEGQRRVRRPSARLDLRNANLRGAQLSGAGLSNSYLQAAAADLTDAYPDGILLRARISPKRISGKTCLPTCSARTPACRVETHLDARSLRNPRASR